MQRRILSGLAALAAALPLAGNADTMDYSYAELGYIDAELDDVDVEGDGLGLRGSLAVNETFFVFAGYEGLEYDFDVESTMFNVGGGGHWPLSDNLDIVGRLGLVSAEIEVGRRDADETGLLLGARLRAAVAPRFEIEGGFDYLDLDDVSEDMFLIGEGRYFFTDQVAGGLSLQLGDDATAIGLNVRLTF